MKKTVKKPIEEIRKNPDNPRYIRGEKFKKLVKSIQDFPEMLELRPLVLDGDGMILGGNQRYDACIEAGLKEIPCIDAEELTEEQQREFIIKDNIGFGEWDWDILANQWDMELLDEYGMDVPYDEDDQKEMQNPENQESEKPFAMELDQESNYIVLKFSHDVDWTWVQTMLGLESVASQRQNGKPWSVGVGRVVDGVKAIKKIKNEG